MLSSALYKKYALKRVFYSAYMPVVAGPNLPALSQRPPLLREHRLYQADWLLRYYGFAAEELLDEAHPNFHPLLDPKCSWAINHMEQFPVEVNRAPLETLLRVPGVGVKSARRIVAARRAGALNFDALKKLGVVLKRAQYFLLCAGKPFPGARLQEEALMRALCSRAQVQRIEHPVEQLSLFDPTQEDIALCLSGQI